VAGEHGAGRVRSREDGYARVIDVQTHPCSKLERVSMKSWIVTTQLLHQNASNRTPFRGALVQRTFSEKHDRNAVLVLGQLFSSRFGRSPQWQKLHHEFVQCRVHPRLDFESHRRLGALWSDVETFSSETTTAQSTSGRF